MPRPDDLAGELRIAISDSHADYFVRDQVAILVEQDLRPAGGRYATWRALPRSAMADQRLVDYAIDAAMDGLRPWTQPDPGWDLPPLFPMLARIEQRLRRTHRALRGKYLRVRLWCASQRRKDGR